MIKKIYHEGKHVPNFDMAATISDIGDGNNFWDTNGTV